MKLIIELTDADAGIAVSATEPANGVILLRDRAILLEAMHGMRIVP